MGALTVVGDCLLDCDLTGSAERLCPDGPAPVLRAGVVRERPGGAGLAAVLLAGDGHDVVLVTALGADAAGARVRRLLDRAGVEVVDLGGNGTTPRKTRVMGDGRVLARVDEEGSPPVIDGAGMAWWRAIDRAEAVLVSDYGRGVTSLAGLDRRLADGPGPVVWDPHPRGCRPPEGIALITPNAGEARRLASAAADDAERARLLVRRWRAGAVAVTLGERGAVMVRAGSGPLTIPARGIPGADACGAGDRFAGAAAAALAAGRAPEEAVPEAVALAGAFVVAGGVAVLRPDGTVPVVQSEDRARQVRSAGGRVVAAGGCFDLLHAGHVAFLEAARAMGDCLVVLMNSDASVAGIKGPDRPLVGQDDRERVLRALACVDDVVVFDESTPERALRRLRPDIFAKGGDHDVDRLPEAEAVRSCGGRVVCLPYIAGRSTTRLIEEAAHRVH